MLFSSRSPRFAPVWHSWTKWHSDRFFSHSQSIFCCQHHSNAAPCWLRLVSSGRKISSSSEVQFHTFSQPIATITKLHVTHLSLVQASKATRDHRHKQHTEGTAIRLQRSRKPEVDQGHLLVGALDFRGPPHHFFIVLNRHFSLYRLFLIWLTINLH